MEKTAQIHKDRATLRAPSKVNLALRVVGRRIDGYHFLDSLVLPLSLCDIVDVRRLDKQELRIRCTLFPDLETSDNLAAKATNWYWERADIPSSERGIEIRIDKQIPVGAGLGGGSADAAATLHALQDLYGSPLNDSDITTECVVLGADVPVCFGRKPRWMAGIGEQIGQPLEIATLSIVLANPGYSVSTRWVYENFDKNEYANVLTKAGNSDRKSGRFLDRETVLSLMENDLERVTLRQYPDLSQMKQTLHEHRALAALMSGSGPTIFGVFEDDQAATLAVDRLKADYPGWRFWKVSNFVEDA